MNNTTIASIVGGTTVAELQNVKVGGNAAPLRVDLVQAGRVVKSISTYKSGDGRELLAEIEEMVRQSQYNDADRAGMAKILVTSLAGDATNDAKAFACRQLWLIGTPAEVPALGNALKDPALSHMARYALQNMESPEVDKVLIAALDGTEPSVQIGVINSLVMRKSPGALDAIKPLRKSKDKAVAAAAKHAIGRLEGKIVP